MESEDAAAIKQTSFLYCSYVSTSCMKRRQAIAVIGVATGLAGCSGGGGSRAGQAISTSYECDISESAGGEVSELPRPVYGSDSAPNTVAVFEDFACPHCRDFHLNNLPNIKDEVNNQDSPDFNIVHHDAPIPVSNWSVRVAQMARFVQDTVGDEAFYTFSKLAYENQDNYSWQALGDAAVDAGILSSPCGMYNAAASEQYNPVISADRDYAFNELQIQGTPAVFVNGELLTQDTVSAVLETLRSTNQT